MTKHENENLSGAYALNAVSAEERAAYEALLADSQAARNEATELQDTAVILGLSVEPVTPPPALRASILEAVARTPQLPMDAAPATPAPADIQEAPAAIATAAERRAQARWFQRPALAVASIAAAVAIIAGGVGIVTDFGQPKPAPTASAIEQLTLASDKQTAEVEVGDATATLLWSDKLGLSALAMDGASEAPSGHVYQLWYIDNKGARDAGIMTASVDDGSWQLLDGTMNVGDAVGVTIEPTGGSKIPTTDPIVVIKS
jgi:anti-sigma-K factor RskA